MLNLAKWILGVETKARWFQVTVLLTDNSGAVRLVYAWDGEAARKLAGHAKDVRKVLGAEYAA